MKLDEHENDTNIRAGILIRLKGTSKFLIEHATGKCPPMPCMDIPKGHIVAGEAIDVGACREVKEETGLDISPSSLKDLGHYKYNKSILCLFYTELDFDITSCHCDSMFTAPNGEKKPEVDSYEFFDIYEDSLDDSLLYKGLKPILKPLFDKIKENDLFESIYDNASKTRI